MDFCRSFVKILILLCLSVTNQAQFLNESEDNNSIRPVIYGCDDKIIKDLIPTLNFVTVTNENLNLKLEILKMKLENLERISQTQSLEYNIKFQSLADNFTESLNKVENNLNKRLEILQDKILRTSDLKLNSLANDIKETIKVKNENLQNFIKQEIKGDLENLKNNVLTPLKMQIENIPNSMEHHESKFDTLLDTPANCIEALQYNQLSNGIFKLHTNGMEPYYGYCLRDSENKTAPAWMVIQRRQNGDVDFYRNWADYKRGFGDLKNEFWFGLDRIHALTSNGDHELLINMEDWEGEKRFAKYNQFKVANEASGYLLTVKGYSGNADDSLYYQSDNKFSTRDVDNDKDNKLNCAIKCKGGWWYESCQISNLNGLYNSTVSHEGINWFSWHRYEYSLKFVQMLIRKKA